MIWNNMELHNVAELEPDPAGGGMLLRRYPREVRQALGERRRYISEEATSCELRFVTAAENVRVALRIPEKNGVVTVYKGGLFHSEHRLQAGVVTTLHLTEPPRLASADRSLLLGSGFASEVWRIRFGRYTCAFHGLNTAGEPVRPPRPGELPDLRWLAYGSSITHGGELSSQAYVDQAARRLGADILNMGLAGACLCEKAAADFLAGRTDWSLATLELGVNMRDSMSVEEFRERSGYLLEQIARNHPDKPVFVITIYPNFATWADNEVTRKDEAFNAVLREHVRRLALPRLQLIEGSSVLTDLSGLSCDLIHPGDLGHIAMGVNLASILQANLH